MSRTNFAAKADRWYRRITGAQAPGERLTAAVNAVRVLAVLLDDYGNAGEAAELHTEAAAALTAIFVRRLTALGVTVPSAPAPTENEGRPQ